MVVAVLKKYMKKISILFLILFFNYTFSFGQDNHSINVYFLYGSKPAPHFKKIEKRYFGGIHAGHVSIGFDTAVVGFTRHNGFHIISHKKKLKGRFESKGISRFVHDTISYKYTTFQILITDSQYISLKTIIKNYLFFKTPYDYAFLGMRCASASYDILSQIGIFKRKSKWCNIFSNFYPKLLRKKMFNLAKINNYKVTKQPGRPSRKWEND